jgi:site-specific recombinase XerD
MRFADEAFFKCIRNFLTVYLPKQRCYSKNTVRSYRITIDIFLDYLTETLRLPIYKLTFQHMTAEYITGFLDWLQTERSCSTATRNQRLMAIRSFAKYAAGINAANIFMQAEIGNIPAQKAPVKMVEFLSEQALKALLAQPDRKRDIGIRDSFFMTLMYDTAARCQEMLDLRWNCFELDTPHPYVRLHGKGNKVRTVPLMEKTVQFLHLYAERFHHASTLKDDSPIFYTVIHGQRNPMSPDTVARFMKQHGETARLNCPDMPERVHPHQLRHTRAIHLYRSGFPLALLAEYLGHVHVETTRVYAYADTEMKRAAIRKADPDNLAVQETAVWKGDDEMIKKLYGLK